MSTLVSVTNITRKAVRIGTTNLPSNGPGLATAVSIDLDALGYGGRHNLMDLIASGSIIAGADPTALKVTNIELGGRNRSNGTAGSNRMDAINLPALVLTSLNVRTLTTYGRQDLQRLLASGSILVGDSTGTANVTLYNLSSKKLRVGSTFIPPQRIAGAEQATDIITLAPAPGLKAGYTFTYNGSAINSGHEYVQGTDLTAAALQTDLITATGDAGLTVTGTTDTGPFTVTYSKGFVPLSAITTVGSVVDVLTLSNTGGAYTFKLTYNAVEGATVFTKASNVTAVAIQAALRAVGGTLALVRVSGTTDLGPFTISFPAGVTPLSTVTLTSPVNGVTGATVATPMLGTDVQNTSQPSALVIADVTALTVGQRRDLQFLLAAGQILSV